MPPSSENRLELAKKHFEQHQTYQKKQYDKNVRVRSEYKINDFVLLENTRQVPGHVRSFEPKFIDPYKILRARDALNFEVEDQKSKRSFVVHRNRMKPFAIRSTINSIDDDALDEATWVRKRIIIGMIVP